MKNKIALVFNGRGKNFAEKILLVALRQLYGAENVLVFASHADAKRRLPGDVSHIVSVYDSHFAEHIDDLFACAAGTVKDVSTVLAVSDLQDHNELRKCGIDYDELLICPERFQGPAYTAAMSRIFGPYVGSVADLESAVRHCDEVTPRVISVAYPSRVNMIDYLN